jgi:homoserine dehydrogenase
MREIYIALLGFGNVGRAFADYVMRMHDGPVRLRICAVIDRSGGHFLEDHEALRFVLDDKAAGHALGDSFLPFLLPDAHALIARLGSDISVLVESLPTNLRDGQPALDLIRHALASGLNVVTVDKGPLAHGFDELRQIAEANHVRLGFTGTTGVAIPDELDGERVIEIRGVLNGTTNYILTEMQTGGASFKEALERAQAAGVAEPDPSLDLDGWDTAVKTLILAKALMNADARLDQVTRIGINAETDALIRAGRESNRRVRLVGRARLYQGRVRVSVVPKLIAADSPFYDVSGTSKLAVFRTASKREVISRARSGRDAIAQTIVDDIVKITAR